MMNQYIRSRLRSAVDALCDEELQERLWVRGERESNSELTFDDAVLLVIDELATTRPSDLVGHVLVDDAELLAFLRLSTSLDALVAVIGDRGTYEDAVATGLPWQEVLAAAQSLRTIIDA